jgi:hypothetical protein
MPESVIDTFCANCKHFVPTFGYCAKYHYILTDATVCKSPTPGEPSWLKQFSAWMEENMHRTHFEYEFDDDGWMMSARLKGAPDVAPYRPVVGHDTIMPHTFVHPKVHCQECSRSNRYCIHPEHDKIITMDDVMNPEKFYVHKLYNRAVARAVSFVTPALYADIEYVTNAVMGYIGGGRNLLNPVLRDKAQFYAFWKDVGYETASVTTEQGQALVLVYEQAGREVVLFDPEDIRFDVLSGLELDIPPTGDKTVLEKFGLTNRCIGCGFPFDTDDMRGPPNPAVCPMCLLPQPTVVFKGE